MNQPVQDRLDRLQRSVTILLARVEHLSDQVIYRAPGPDEWPAMSTLAHVAEILPYWAHAAEHIANAPGTPFGRTHTDPDRISAVAEHAHDSREVVVNRIRAGLDQALRGLRSIPADAWDRTGLHPRRGAMSIAQVVDEFLLEHVDEHCAQLEITLRAVGAQSSQVP